MPKDPTPLGDELAHRMPEPKFPQPKPDQPSDAPESGQPSARGGSADVSHRPELPDHPVTMSADIEDEEADPVIDTGPGIDDGPHSLKKQRG